MTPSALERRFLSRCKVLEFSSYGLAGEITSYLDRVWHAEGGDGMFQTWHVWSKSPATTFATASCVSKSN